jgi:hypothetical protein
MKWFKRKQQPKIERKILVNKVYTDKFGNDWFEYANPMELPAKRAIAAEVATRFAEMNLTKQSLVVLLEDMKKKANDGNIVELFGLLNEIEFRLNFIGEEQTLLELATCYFLLADEDEADFTDLYKSKKLEILKSDSDAKAFFIKGAFGYTMKYSNLLDVDILDYLNLNAPNEKRLEQILQELSSRNTSTTSTTSTKSSAKAGSAT